MHLRPQLFEKGSLEKLMQQRDALNRKDCEEAAEAAAAAVLATQGKSTTDESQGTADAVPVEGTETDTSDARGTTHSITESPSVAVTEVPSDPRLSPSVAEPETQPQDGSHANTDNGESQGPEVGAPSALATGDTLHSLLNELFVAVANDMRSSRDPTKPARQGKTVFQITDDAQWVIDLETCEVTEHPASLSPEAAGYDTSQTLIVSCKEKNFVSLVTGKMSPLRAVRNIKLRGNKKPLRDLLPHLRSVGSQFRARFTAAAKAGAIRSKNAALERAAEYSAAQSKSGLAAPATPMPTKSSASEASGGNRLQQPDSSSNGDSGDLVFFMDASMWVPNEDAPNCAVCGSKFRMMLRRHHCRVCGEVVCAKCSNHRLFDQRACTLCFQRFSSAKSARKATSSSRRNLVRARYRCVAAVNRFL